MIAIPLVEENQRPITAATTKAPVMLATNLALLRFAATGLWRRLRGHTYTRHCHLLKRGRGDVLMKPAVDFTCTDETKVSQHRKGKRKHVHGAPCPDRLQAFPG